MKESQAFQIDAAGVTLLKTCWQTLVEQYPADATTGEQIFDSLVTLYSEKGRFYHNLSHVKALLSLSKSYEPLFVNQDAVSFAIWFHDAVYATKKSDNEERSAELATRSLTQLAVPNETTTLVHQMILATKHLPADELPADTKIFLDLDLSILGTKAEFYREYSRAIRKEYSWVPMILYRRERKKILSRFLQRRSIYYTAPMIEQYETPARQNIEAEIKELS